MLRLLESLTYFFMSGGGDQDEHGAAKQPSTTPRSLAALPIRNLLMMVRHTLSEFATALQDYADEASPNKFFLLHLGVPAEDLESDKSMRTFRRYMIGASVGVFRRLSIRLHSFPLNLWLLAEPGVDGRTQRECAATFCSMEPCCLGVFGRRLRALCPTAQSLLSNFGRTVISTWLASMQWSFYPCEKEHASCRRLCNASGPARNWSLAARERLVEGVRATHKERCGVDLAVHTAARGQKRNAGGAPASGPTDAALQDNPLYTAAVQFPDVAAAWLGQAALVGPSAQAAGATPQDVVGQAGAEVASGVGEARLAAQDREVHGAAEQATAPCRMSKSNSHTCMRYRTAVPRLCAFSLSRAKQRHNLLVKGAGASQSWAGLHHSFAPAEPLRTWSSVGAPCMFCAIVGGLCSHCVLGPSRPHASARPRAQHRGGRQQEEAPTSCIKMSAFVQPSSSPPRSTCQRLAH